MRTLLRAFKPLIRLGLPGLILCDLFFTAKTAPALDQSGTSPGEMESGIQTVTPDVFDGDVRDLPVSTTWRSGDPITEIPRLVYPRSQTSPQLAPGSDSGHRDPLLDVQASAQSQDIGHAFFPPDLNFAGMGFSGAFPPDPVGDVGPNHYVQMINGASGAMVQIFDKTTGASLAGPFNLETLVVGGTCASGRGDGIALYDRAADRWLLSEFAGTGATSSLCVYISQTPSPITGGWFRYTFTTPNFPDYPKYGVWPDAYYVSTNEASPAVYALERTTMLTGGAARSVRFTAPRLAGFGFQALIPSDLDGPTAPPAGSPNFFMRHRDDEVHNVGANDPAQDFVEVWEFRVNFAGGSTFTGPSNIPVAEFSSELCGLTSFNCFPQPGTTRRLDPLREVIMWRLQYQNFGTHETLLGNFVTDVDGTDHGGIRWFELRRTPPGAGAWTLVQQGTHAPDAANRWMGSIAMDKDRNIALGYSTSSSTVFPSIRYAGRLASDPLGTLQAENTLQAGVASQTNFDRWGDYAAMSVDPSDDCTFWFTTEYVPAMDTWATRIGKFKFPICGVTDLLFLSKADSPDPVIVNQNLTYTLVVNNPSAAPATGVMLTDTLPSGVTFVSASSTQGTCSQADGMVTCNLGTVAGGATVTVTIVIQPTQIGTLNNSATVTAAETDPNTSNNSASATTGVVPNLPGSYSGSSTSGNTETVTNCIDPTSNGVFQFNSSITISTQTGGNFTATGTLTGVGSFQGTTINVTNAAGTIGSSGAITGGTFNYSTVRGGMTMESGTGTFTGMATASPTVSQLVFNFSSQSTSGTGCRSTGTVTVTPTPSGGGGGGGGCFIATAAFGSPMAVEVQVLREFRDEELLTHAPGRWLVAAYYWTSPPLARLIGSNEVLRSATRITLRPVIWWAALALESPVLAWSLLILGAGGMLVVVITPWMLFRATRPGATQPLNPRGEG